MERHWLARPYKYADGMAWNPDRYEIFFRNDQNQWISVGGAWYVRKATAELKVGVIAFLCDKPTNRLMRKPHEVLKETLGTRVWGATLHEALRRLKQNFPDPDRVVDQYFGFEVTKSGSSVDNGATA